jgi:carbamoyltransferase
VTSILGISAYYHDSAAAVVRDGRIVAAAQEERFSRKRHDARLPRQAIEYCLREADTALEKLDAIVFYDKPLLKFERLLETYLYRAPRGFTSFVAAMPIWLKEKLYLKMLLKKEIAAIGRIGVKQLPRLLFTEHHQAHAASAFYASPFRDAAVLCLDGVGEWATSSAWIGAGKQLRPLWQIDFPHSLGLLYSAFTYYIGFRVNSGEYKLMGLAPYGQPRYAERILSNLVDLKDDGSFRLETKYFDYETGLRMTNRQFDELFDGKARTPEEPLTQRHMDLAASIQVVTEEIMLRLARTVRKETGAENLCLAGGVALNCVANGRILREAGFKDIWIQPAAGDAGGAVGAALAAWHQYYDGQRCLNDDENAPHDGMSGSFLGPRFSNDEGRQMLDAMGARYTIAEDAELLPRVASLLDQGNVIGWFSGRMEFGPRSLGARSILGDPRNPSMQSTMNLRIKFRESFRPFAPAILLEDAPRYFDIDRPSPYMLLVAQIRDEFRLPMSEADQNLFGIDRLNVPRSTIPATTHVDYSSRLQTADSRTNPRFHALLHEFKKLTSCPVLVNTSFNVRGEPIVCTPADAYRCFMNTEMEYLVIENLFLDKREQSPLPIEGRAQYEPD